MIPTILVYNKADLPRDPRLPNDEEISAYAVEQGFFPQWFKTSAKTGKGIQVGTPKKCKLCNSCLVKMPI
jgi:hypothetical protein